MKAAVLHQVGRPLRIEDVSVPQIGPEDVLVHTQACGICGTYFHIRDGWGYTPSSRSLWDMSLRNSCRGWLKRVGF